MVSFYLGEDHRQKSERAYELLTARAKKEQQRTVNGVDDESLAHGVLVVARPTLVCAGLALLSLIREARRRVGRAVRLRAYKRKREEGEGERCGGDHLR